MNNNILSDWWGVLADGVGEARNVYSTLKFGDTTNIVSDGAANKIDIAQLIHLPTDNLPIRFQMTGLPVVTRVENQLKLNVSLISKPGCNLVQTMAHLPMDSMAKEKFYLNDNQLNKVPQFFKDSILYVDAYLVDTKQEKLINVCERCVKREQRRASRRKSGLSDNMHWCNNPNRSALIFNQKQLFPIDNINQQQINFELRTRIVCYCRHHKSDNGFNIMFILRDSSNCILGKYISSNIIIMDRKQQQQGSITDIDMKRQNSSNVPSDIDTFKKELISPLSTPVDSKNKFHREQSIESIHLINGSHFPSPSSQAEDNLESFIVNNNNNNNSNNILNNLINNTIANEIANDTEQDIILENMLNNIDTSLPINSTNNNNNFDNNLNNNNNQTMTNTTNTPSLILPNSMEFINIQNTNYNININNDNNNTHFYKRPRTSLTDSSISSVSSLPYSNKNNNLSSSLTTNESTSNLSFPFNSEKQLPPIVHRVIPSQGSITGGIEITLLGSNFRDGQIVKFGNNIALSTQFWNLTTLVTYLPPSNKPGPVIVTIEDNNIHSSSSNRNISNNNSSDNNTDLDNRSLINDNAKTSGPIFTYLDDTDKKIVELALQIVGLKMNGKLDDPRNIARQIIDSSYRNNDQNANSIGNNEFSSTSSSSYQNSYSQLNDKNSNTELLLIDIIKRSKDFNFTLSDESGRTILHYACLKSYKSLVELLLIKSRGLLSQLEDSFGYLPLHFAAVHGDMDIIKLLNKYSKEPNSYMRKAINGITPKQLYLTIHMSFDNFEENVSNVKDSNISSYDMISSSDNNWTDYETDYNTENETEEEQEEEQDNHNNYNEGINSTNVEQKLSVRKSNVDLSRSVSINDVNSSTDANVSLWDRMKNRINDDILPKYEDLFPKGLLGDSKTDKVHTTNTSESVDSINVNNSNTVSDLPSTVTSSCSSLDDEDVDEDDDDDKESEFEKLFHQSEINFQNDKMLQFFWLPLLIILSSWMVLYAIGSTDSIIPKFSDNVTKYMGIMITKVVLGRERVSHTIKNHFHGFQPSKILSVLPSSLDDRLAA